VRKGRFHPKRGRKKENKEKTPRLAPTTANAQPKNRIHEIIRRAFGPDGAEQGGEEKGGKIDNT
jgi:hypothetical protein